MIKQREKLDYVEQFDRSLFASKNDLYEIANRVNLTKSRSANSLENFRVKHENNRNLADVTGRVLTPLGYLRMGWNTNDIREGEELQTTMALVKQQVNTRMEAKVDDVHKVAYELLDYPEPLPLKPKRKRTLETQTDFSCPEGLPHTWSIDVSKVLYAISRGSMKNVDDELTLLTNTVQRLIRKERDSARMNYAANQWAPRLVDPLHFTGGGDQSVAGTGLGGRLVELIDKLPLDSQADELGERMVAALHEAMRAANPEDHAAIDRMFLRSQSRQNKIKVAHGIEALVKLLSRKTADLTDASARAVAAERRVAELEAEVGVLKEEVVRQRARASVRVALDAHRAAGLGTGPGSAAGGGAALWLEKLGLSVAPVVLGGGQDDDEEVLWGGRRVEGGDAGSVVGSGTATGTGNSSGGNAASGLNTAYPNVDRGQQEKEAAAEKAKLRAYVEEERADREALVERVLREVGVLTKARAAASGGEVGKVKRSGLTFNPVRPGALPDPYAVVRAGAAVGLHPECVPVYSMGTVRGLAARVVQLQERVKFLCAWIKNNAFAAAKETRLVPPGGANSPGRSRTVAGVNGNTDTCAAGSTSLALDKDPAFKPLMEGFMGLDEILMRANALAKTKQQTELEARTVFGSDTYKDHGAVWETAYAALLGQPPEPNPGETNQPFSPQSAVASPASQAVNNGKFFPASSATKRSATHHGGPGLLDPTGMTPLPDGRASFKAQCMIMQAALAANNNTNNTNTGASVTVTESETTSTRLVPISAAPSSTSITAPPPANNTSTTTINTRKAINDLKQRASNRPTSALLQPSSSSAALFNTKRPSTAGPPKLKPDNAQQQDRMASASTRVPSGKPGDARLWSAASEFN